MVKRQNPVRTAPCEPADPAGATGAALPFPIVGIGASAGGLAAFEAFFSGIAADVTPGMAFVLVQHLSAEHPSLLPELVRRFTHLPVDEVTDGMAVAVNHVHVIPPGWDLEIRDGHLQLVERVDTRGQHLPIDAFFASLADDRQDRAIAIVLSGTGRDGAQGLRSIKAKGGLTLVQSPQTAEFDGMPRAALDTGVVDHELAPQAMWAKLLAYAARAFEEPSWQLSLEQPGSEAALKQIFVQLQAQTRHDFSHYKSSTVLRRLQRRMAVHQIDTFEAYASLLQQSADEVQALFQDLLIGVTQFFRDPEVFDVLEHELIPGLLARRVPGKPLRVWVSGCATGEEAYSIAMLVMEQLNEPATPQVLQLFATDIDSRAIAVGRAGVYPAGQCRDIPPERLARHFTPESDGTGFRVRKQLRDLLIFSEHDLIRDPPFSKMDLISCRNLLIYLDATLQKRVIPMFHYALKAGGSLMLGTSESTGDHHRLFEPINRKAKLYRRLPDYPGRLPATVTAQMLPARTLATRTDPAHPADPPSMPDPKPPLREITERAILRALPVAAALVNAQGDIFYLHGRTGMYLEPAPGEAGVNNILAMAREGLRPELSLALAQTAATRKTSAKRSVRVKTNGHHSLVDFSVSALDTDSDPTGPQLYLVLFEIVDAAESGAAVAASVGVAADDGEVATDSRVEALAQALRVSEEHVQALHEELESSIEELKSSNEEMQSVNEELQSTNEELETSKEELQSVNEELSTVNSELENKVADLSRTNDDMNNLLAGSGIATVFVDHGLRLMRFTPGASEIIHLIAGDVGRPVGHLASNLEGYDSLVADTQAVLDSLIPKVQEVRTRSGRWYAMRIQPYRTIQNVIEGAVITFADISDSMQTRLALRKVNEVLRLAVVVRDAFDAITVHDLDGRTLAWNPAATALYGWSETEALALNVRDRVPPALRTDALAQLQQLTLADVQNPHQTQRLTRDGRQLDVCVQATALLDSDGRVYAIATTERALPG